VLCKTRLVSLRLTRTRRRLFLTTVDCANLSLAFYCQDHIIPAIVFNKRLHSLMVDGDMRVAWA